MVHDTLPPEHFALIRNIAYRVVRRLPFHAVSVEELVSAGYLGYREARERYDPTQGGRFETFAEFRIRGAMLDDLRERDHLSRYIRHMKNRIEEARCTLVARLVRPPSRMEVAAYLEVRERAVEAIDGMPDYAEFLADRLDAHGELIGMPDDQHADTPFDHYEVREAAEHIEQALSTLSVREVRVLHALYVEGLYLREVANRLGVSPSRVCQIRLELLAKLRVACEEPLAA
ncbi:MAG: sigma-70 family RNA polymerase sigma factor [bacterium]|nr:sigma-70 family RNA polymerase sigma factor [bacterium]